MYFLPKKMGFIKKIIKDKNESINEPIFDTLIKNGNKIANSSAVVKKAKLLDIGLISEKDEKFSWEDYDCWLRLASKQNKFYFINKVLGYCWHGDGRISNSYQSYKNCKNIMKIYRDSLYKILQNKPKRPKWISKIYSNIFFESKSFLKSFHFLKYGMDKKLSTLLKYAYLFFIVLILKTSILKIKKFKNNLKKIFNKIIIYEFKKNYIKNNENFNNNNFTYHVLNKYNEFRNCKNFFHSFNNKVFFKRFKNNDAMVVLIDKNSNNIACYGWIKKKTPHFIEEINNYLYFNNGYVLYDFNTLNEYKNKKLYKSLLNKITLNIEKPLYIYSLSSNKVSTNAIKNIGFTSLKKLNILSHDFIQKSY